MKTEHPITLPLELVAQWWDEFEHAEPDIDSLVFIATQAARWGADMELDACCEWLSHDCDLYRSTQPKRLRAARRPEPPSLKEQALDSWDRLRNEAWCEEIDFDLDFIRRALESLPS